MKFGCIGRIPTLNVVRRVHREHISTSFSLIDVFFWEDNLMTT